VDPNDAYRIALDTANDIPRIPNSHTNRVGLAIIGVILALGIPTVAIIATLNSNAHAECVRDHTTRGDWYPEDGC
jgi:hypothetical protein